MPPSPRSRRRRRRSTARRGGARRPARGRRRPPAPARRSTLGRRARAGRGGRGCRRTRAWSPSRIARRRRRRGAPGRPARGRTSARRVPADRGCRHDWRVPSPPLSFASSEPLTAEELLSDAGPRLPRPSLLAAPLAVSPAPAAKGAERLGLLTVGDLLEHLPRDRSQARTIAELAPDEVATVVVEVRSIASRPVRRRGMKPLVEATVADETGVVKATFFNQPWLERKYR